MSSKDKRQSMKTKEELKALAEQLYPREHNDKIFTPTVRSLQQNAFIKGYEKRSKESVHPKCEKHDLRKIEYSHECRKCGELFTI